jgi:anion-transporting  ArsA/GET3 family ATPase
LEPTAFCARTKVLVVAGKGGVGKTTVTAAVAHMAADAGLRVLIVEVEGANALAPRFGLPGPLTYREVVLADLAGAGEVRARTLTPDDALVEYLEDHGMRRISRRLVATGTLDVVATAVPGIKDILVLGKVKQLERAAAAGAEGAPDLIVVDAPAAGHAVQFLASGAGLLDAVAVGPIRSQAIDVTELLQDPSRCQVLLVTLAEETPVNEVAETAFHLEDRAGVQLGPVVVNGLLPTVDLQEPAPSLASDQRAILQSAAAFRRRRQELQAEQVRRLRDLLPLPQLHLPFLFTGEIGRRETESLARALAGEVAGLPTSGLP